MDFKSSMAFNIPPKHSVVVGLTTGSSLQNYKNGILRMGKDKMIFAGWTLPPAPTTMTATPNRNHSVVEDGGITGS